MGKPGGQAFLPVVSNLFLMPFQILLPDRRINPRNPEGFQMPKLFIHTKSGSKDLCSPTPRYVRGNLYENNN
jgi:hypothetical protein